MHETAWDLGVRESSYNTNPPLNPATGKCSFEETAGDEADGLQPENSPEARPRYPTPVDGSTGENSRPTDIEKLRINLYGLQLWPDKVHLRDYLANDRMYTKQLQSNDVQPLSVGTQEKQLLFENELRLEMNDTNSLIETSDSSYYFSAVNLHTSGTDSLTTEFETFQHTSNSSVSSESRVGLDICGDDEFEISTENHPGDETEERTLKKSEGPVDDPVSSAFEESLVAHEIPEKENTSEPLQEVFSDKENVSQVLGPRKIRKSRVSKSFNPISDCQQLLKGELHPNQVTKKLGASMLVLTASKSNEDFSFCHTEEEAKPIPGKDRGKDCKDASSPSCEVRRDLAVKENVSEEMDSRATHIQSSENTKNSDNFQVPKSVKEISVDMPFMRNVSPEDCKDLEEQFPQCSQSTRDKCLQGLQHRTDNTPQDLTNVKDTFPGDSGNVQHDSSQGLQNQKWHSRSDLRDVNRESPKMSLDRDGDSRHALQNRKSDAVPVPPPRKSPSRVKNKPSLAILRIQEQLRRGLQYDANKGKNKVKQLQELLLKHEIRDELPGSMAHIRPNNLVTSCSSGRQNKSETQQAKPYRQWHRVSKCVAAESRYIISSIPPLPAVPAVPILKDRGSHATDLGREDTPSVKETRICGDSALNVCNHENHKLKTNQQALDIDEDLVTGAVVKTSEVTEKVKIKSPDWKEPLPVENQHESSIPIHCSPEYQVSLTSCESIGDAATPKRVNEISLQSWNKDGETGLELSLPGTCNNDGSVGAPECQRYEMSDTSLLLGTAPECQRYEMSDTSLPLGTEADDPILTGGPKCGVEKHPHSQESKSLGEKYPLNQNQQFITSVQYFRDSAEMVSDTKHSCINSVTSRAQTPRAQTPVNNPFDSVTGVSQVTGPPSPVLSAWTKAKVVRVHTPTRGPTLRTATRSRYRRQSPSDAAQSNNSFSASDVPTSSSYEGKYHGRSTSRVANKTGLRHSSSRHTLHSRHSSRPSRAASRHATQTQGLSIGTQNTCAPQSESQSSRGQPAFRHPHETHRTAENGSAMQKLSLLSQTSKAAKVFGPDLASKFMQKVNRVHKTHQSKKYVDVQATVDYKGSLPGQLSFRKGQMIKQRSTLSTASDGISYGYYRVGKLRKKRKGLFPASCVTADIVGSGHERESSICLEKGETKT